ncbi:hypothetical protein [Streptomyces sp. NPDC088812]|uniref:hypothetical protein n=1 Tax=Streptomyces sp. NPDC088812 TaxID=3365905 RepID=UPI0037FFFB24
MSHRIEPGQIYRSLGDPYPYTEPRRIKVVGDPITTWGRYGYGKVDVVTLTTDGREIRRRAIETSQLHAGPIGHHGRPLRTGYVLEES